jgi:hypothetical protein
LRNIQQVSGNGRKKKMMAVMTHDNVKSLIGSLSTMPRDNGQSARINRAMILLKPVDVFADRADDALALAAIFS